VIAPEVWVLGGGPAGATASLLLASWGHSVELSTRPAGDHRLAVSIPPSAAKLFDAVGVSDAIDAAGFIRSTGNTVWWGGSDARVEPFTAGARGWQLEVDRLSQVLLDRAMATGVRVDRRIVSEPARSGFVLDCTGRAGIVARLNGVRRHTIGPRTIALVGEWRRSDAWPVPDETHTLIESYDDGWMWSVPIAAGARHICAMVDPQRSGLARGGSSTDVYLAEIDKTREFKRLSAGAALQDGPRGWDASPYEATEYAGEHWLLVGDAGSFIDPLSSVGVKKALASGWLAAVTVHTCLTSPAMKPHALAFFSSREREIAAHLSRESRRFLADAAAGHRHAFWEDRADEVEDRPEDRHEIQRAFERLKSADAFRVSRGPINVEARPCVRGREIVLEPHIVPDRESNGVRYIRNIDVVALIELAPAARQVPDLYEAYQERLGSAPLDDFLFALATAVARGWLVAE
jgi:flavin-dependent dehydrogenase